MSSKLDGLIPRLVMLALGAGAAAELAHLAVPWQYRQLYEKVGGEQGVDPNLLHALGLQENWQQNPNAVGAPNANGTRDYGLMQINTINLDTMGLGTVEEGRWRDPYANVKAAAELIDANKMHAPGLGLLDQFAVYNAGFSAYGPRPKFDTAGVYINQRYVWSAFLWYVAVVLAQFAPLKIKQLT